MATYQVTMNGETFTVKGIDGTETYNGRTALKRGDLVVVEIPQERGNSFRVLDDDE